MTAMFLGALKPVRGPDSRLPDDVNIRDTLDIDDIDRCVKEILITMYYDNHHLWLGSVKIFNDGPAP